MNIIETTFEKLPTKYLLIGFEGENLRATVRIDCASVFAEYPNATPALIVKPLFADAYPVVVDRNGTCVDWLITSEILSFSGDGEIQLVFYKDQVICKSAVSKIRVSRSLQVTGEKPDPIARWEDAANQKLAEVDAAIVSIDEMDATAHGLPEGSAPTAEVQTVDDHKRIVLGIPVGATGAKGDKGDKGDRGEIGATPQMGIGQVSTLPAGSSATASMSGTTENPLLNLGIPQGIQGVKGDRGEKGDTGATGATGATPDLSIGTVSTLPAGSSATAEITGTAENPVLSLGIPQGIQGVQGVQGEKGDPGEGVPTGGLKGQVLAKASDTDRATEWINVAPVIKNTASGAIASFADGADGHPVDELKVSIEPVQDLHGYDHPWPVGGGVNLLPTPVDGTYEAHGAKVVVKDGVITLSGTTTSSGNVAIIPLASVVSVPVGAYIHLLNSFVNASVSVTFELASDIQNTVVSISTSPTNRIYQNPRETVVTWDRIRLYVGNSVTISGTISPMLCVDNTSRTFAPYSNICPITGHTGAQITRNAGNYAEMDSVLVGYALDSSGAAYSETGMITTDYMPVGQGDEVNLYFVSKQGARSRRVIGYNEDKTYNSTLYESTWATVDAAIDRTYTIQSGIAFIRASYYSGDVNKSLVNKTYESVYPISWQTEAGTVYGGELTVNADGSGSLVVDRIEWTAPRTRWGTYTSGAGYTFYYTTLPSETVDVIANAPANRYYSVSDTFTYYTLPDNWWTNAPNCGYVYNVSGVSGAKRVWVRYDGDNFEDVVEGAKFIFLLQTPLTYTLTASQIRTLLGQNHIWSDAGDVSVKYNADTKLYIDNKITQAIAAALNS